MSREVILNEGRVSVPQARKVMTVAIHRIQQKPPKKYPII